MLPTKLASAAFLGTRSGSGSPGVDGVLMTFSCRDRRCVGRDRGKRPAAYVPTGYVPDGEVTAVTCQAENGTGRGAAGGGPGRSATGGQPGHDDIAEDLPLVRAPGGIEHVPAEDGAERVPVRRAEDAVRADHLVHVERVDVLAEQARVPTPLQDRAEDVERRVGQAREHAGARQVLRPVDVL